MITWLSHGSEATETTNIADLPDAVQLQCFSYLSPRELFVAASSCKSWSHLIQKDSPAWQARFLSKWGPPGGVTRARSWFSRFGQKMRELEAWHGRFRQDSLYGHQQGIRACKLHTSQNLLVTGARPVCCATSG